MKTWKRSLSFGEKVALLVLGLVLILFLYYYLVDRPVRTGIAEAKAESDNIQVELTAVQARLGQLEAMQGEMDDVSDSVSMMPSYNAVEDEIALLNDIMEAAEDYSVTFDQVTRDGNQIRRNFSVQFTAENYDTAVTMLQQIAGSKYRCRLNEISCTHINTTKTRTSLSGRTVTVTVPGYSDGQREDLLSGEVDVSCTATFYETMVGGKEDSGLPKENEEEDVELNEVDYDY